ncbi:MAG: FAD-dependent oxidoreductase [Ignavibacteria bacterium]
MYNFVSLNVKCPLCGTSLMDPEQLVDNEPSIKLKIEVENKIGTINLSSIYGSYNYVCSFEVPENAIATFICPSCNQVINSKVVVAIGTGPNPVIFQTNPDLKRNKWGYLEVNPETMETSKEFVYAGGDIVTGSATVILAMGAGRIAANAIHKKLSQLP